MNKPPPTHLVPSKQREKKKEKGKKPLLTSAPMRPTALEAKIEKAIAEYHMLPTADQLAKLEQILRAYAGGDEHKVEGYKLVYMALVRFPPSLPPSLPHSLASFLSPALSLSPSPSLSACPTLSPSPPTCNLSLPLPQRANLGLQYQRRGVRTGLGPTAPPRTRSAPAHAHAPQRAPDHGSVQEDRSGCGGVDGTHFSER